MKVTLITGRSLGQGKGKEKGKFSKEYFENVSICEFDPDDMASLNIVEGSKVSLSTPYGSAVLKAVTSKQFPHKSIVFIPYGPWANLLTEPNTQSSGMPSFKGIEAEVKPAKEGEVEPLQTVLKRLRRL